MSEERKYEEEARELANAIKKMVENDNLMNFESYLSYHFDIWFTKYANSIDGLIHEFKTFAEMEV